MENKDWNCNNYNDDMRHNGEEIDKRITSVNKKDSLKLVYQKD